MLRNRLWLLSLAVLLTLVLASPGLGRAEQSKWKIDGFVEGSLYQPHGRFEPYPGVFDNDRAAGRFGLETALEIHQAYIPRLFAYADLLFHQGKREPRFDYNWNMGVITVKRRWGAGITLFYEPNIELRVTHCKWNDLVGYVGEPLIWNAVQLRWNYDLGGLGAEGPGWRFKGWLEGSFYPDHNEYDPNPRIEFQERVVSRYGLEGSNLFVHSAVLELVFFFNFFACFGDSRPQSDYNYRADPIGLEINFGLGWAFGPNRDFQIRLTHDRWVDLGGMKVDRVAWTGLQFRWTFSYPRGGYPQWREKAREERAEKAYADQPGTTRRDPLPSLLQRVCPAPAQAADKGGRALPGETRNKA
jgi:hypothetical protein